MRRKNIVDRFLDGYEGKILRARVEMDKSDDSLLFELSHSLLTEYLERLVKVPGPVRLGTERRIWETYMGDKQLGNVLDLFMRSLKTGEADFKY